MTARVAYSRRAAAEVEEITASLAELSPSAAERFSQGLARAEQQLADFPNSGALGRLPGTRRLIVANYVLSYRRRGDYVEIFSVRNARRATLALDLRAVLPTTARPLIPSQPGLKPVLACGHYSGTSALRLASSLLAGGQAQARQQQLAVLGVAKG